MKKGQKGFSVVETLVAILVVALLVGGAAFVYLRSQKKADTAKVTNETTTSARPKDEYAGWKTNCDAVYHYCFKYPQDWALSANSTATKYCEAGQVSLLSPLKSVQVSYTNDDSHDVGLFPFYPVSLTNLSTANQDLSIVGGYIPSSGDNGVAGNNVPMYQMIDASVLNAYPLTVGKQTEFPNNPKFTDKGTGLISCSGTFVASPTVTVNSLEQTNAWFKLPDTQTSLLILKSFSYKP